IMAGHRLVTPRPTRRSSDLTWPVACSVGGYDQRRPGCTQHRGDTGLVAGRPGCRARGPELVQGHLAELRAACAASWAASDQAGVDRTSTRLNSSHVSNSYAV